MFYFSYIKYMKVVDEDMSVIGDKWFILTNDCEAVFVVVVTRQLRTRGLSKIRLYAHCHLQGIPNILSSDKHVYIRTALCYIVT